MVNRSAAPLRERVHALGYLGAFLAVLGQLLLGAASGRAAAVETAAAVFETAVICHGDGGSGEQKNAPHHHNTSDCAICPLCLSLAPLGALIAETPAVPRARSITHALICARPPVRAPPPSWPAQAYPRGPPLLS